jgi:tRNA (guanosine-2'-O-)-methyltransferase
MSGAPSRGPGLLASDLVVDSRKERIEQVLSHRTRTLTVVLDKLEDAFNMSAVLRTCEGMGVQEVHVIRNPEHPFAPNLKVTQGSEKWVDIVEHPDFASCRAHLSGRGFALWASALRPDAQSLFQLRFDQKMALIFGNERHGVSAEVMAGCDGVFWIPMRGFIQSLNVSASVCASITRAVAWRDEHLGPGGDLTPEQTEALRQRFLHLSVKQRDKIFKQGGP